MARWPDVPDVYGWLRLDLGGRWRLRGEVITHPRTVAFIARHYRCDERGCWYFQNGPQRVFVGLDYTPWVHVLDASERLAVHTGAPVTALRRAFVDEHGRLLLVSEHGIGVVAEPDLPRLAGALEDASGAACDERHLAALMAGDPAAGALALRWRALYAPVEAIASGTVAARFAFVPEPEPP